jgi:chorismate mutase
MTAPDKQLDDLRQEIDALDDQMLQILARRFAVVRAVGHYKQAHGLPPLDEQRWQALLKEGLSQAELLNLPPDFITELYELIHRFALQIEVEIQP